MQTRYVILFLLLSLRVSFVQAESPDLCKDGILLFREDFGGNDPSDPAISRTPVSGMSSGYTQIYKLQTSDPGRDMGAGSYLVAKRGYRNSSIPTYSVWHVMDDHTYFGDTTRGYLLEIDGKGSGNDVFYSTVIDGLCAGSRLTFSAYVANLTTAGQYNAWRDRNYVHPRLSFVLTHPQTDAELARYNTDTISHDWSNYPKSWRETAEWQLIGMNFTVPEGIDAVRLSIRNNASGSSTGNDFALDDIEIRLCLPPVTVSGDDEVCQGAATTLTAGFVNDGTLAEPLEYKWWHSEDSLTWTELSNPSASLTLASVQKTDSGWYKVAVAGAGNIENINCRALSEPFRLTIKECEPPVPELCIDGTLLFREDFGGNDVNDPRVSSTPVPGMSYRQSTHGMGSGMYMVTKSGYCNGDTTGWTIPGADLSTKRSQWYIQDDHTYPNDYTRGYFLEIDGSGGTQQFYQTEISGLCEGIELTFSAYVANVFTWFQYDWYTRNRGPVISPCLKFVLTNPQTGATLAEKNTKEIPFDENLPAKTDWQYSSQWHLVGMNFTVPVGVDAIRLTIYNNVTNGNGNDFAIDDIEIHLCMTPDTIRTDTIVCDTLPQITWRGKTFAITDTLRDTLRSSCGFDSIYYLMRVETEHCESPCPEMHYATRDTTVCDTLMPFTWHGLLFNEPGSQTTTLQDVRGCDTLQTTWTLDTIHCERQVIPEPITDTLYPIIVNKYNWQLLCHNVRVRELFPELTVNGYQWYKDGTAIPNATEDDYSEQNELQGAFQLRLLMSDGRYVWSEILTIQPAQTQVPSHIRIYNHNGYLFYQSEKETTIPSLPRGLYIIQIEQNGEQRIEKKLIP
ncbi:MAG: T9SS type A sorting domain-containing protein [Paludibacteraceae bacterium]|nr:T9SS type A sorting domain-containing protein [Paludibacteraceae bacterium]